MDASSQAPVMDLEEFRALAHRMVDYIVDYYKNINSHSVRSAVQPGYLKPLIPENPPEKPETLEDILRDVTKKILPGVTHWQSPNFFAYFPANVSIPGFLGDMLSGALNVVGFSWIASPAATELETITLDWFANLLDLPSQFKFFASGGTGGGSIQGTASESVLVVMLAARNMILTKMVECGIANGEAFDKLVVYVSDQGHSSIQKACKIAGILECNVRVLPTSASSAYALSAETLEIAIREDKANGLIPFFLAATIGTTSSTAVDHVSELGDIAREHALWFHVDGAYAGSAMICEEYRHHMHGIEKADSFCVNAHKWLLTNFPCSCLWVKDLKSLKNVLSTTPEFLRNKASETHQVIDFKDLQIPLGRSFRSLKLWMVLRMYGSNKLKEYIRYQISLAQHFEKLVLSDDRFEVVAPRTFALVCFRLKPSCSSNKHDIEDNGFSLNKMLLEILNDSGHLFLTHTVLSGVYTIRFVIANSRTEICHVKNAWKVIQDEASKLLSSR